MTYTQIAVVENHQIFLKLPNQFRNGNSVRVIVEENIESKKDKFTIMKLALTDPLFLSDVQSVNDDFGISEGENL